MHSTDEDEVVHSSDDDTHDKIWDLQDEDPGPNGVNSRKFYANRDYFLPSSDDPDMFQQDKVLSSITSSNSSSGVKRRGSAEHEKLWEGWHKSLKSSTRINEMTMEMKSFSEVRLNEQALRRKNSPLHDRELQIADSIKRPIPSSLLRELAADISDTTLDWYFLREDPDFGVVPDRISTFLGKNGSVPIRDLYKKFGADCSIDIGDSYCPYGKLIPVETMCSLIKANNTDTADSFKCFIKFILDRQISSNLSASWVRDIWESFSCDKIALYLEVVPRNRYLLHYRITRLLPLQEDIVSRLFPKDDGIITEFENLLDSHQWTYLLYFIMLVLGTSALPFGPSAHMTYIEDCILDLNTQNHSQIQLSVIKSYITVCSKIK
ncbi:unnamed protein product [Kluyveromyces dobzhanskii CBS 2104]|uniref:WGS project CCBQ000000000 data, contig 00028 n=1 Tax=Kluyveromyces dobzhanskii CBS 2104 TaxID=1427455 RepID=A0A0A8L0T1_9SACH|nr:unnamed protein product [Kluyveromyces dobzhanskii CBS 2104]